MRLAGQCIAYAVFFALVAGLSARPTLRLLAEDEAVISLSFSHAAQRIGECTRLTQEQLDALPPNMRKPDSCPRGRHPLHVALWLGESKLYDATLAPSGVHADGKASVYERFLVPAGAYQVTVRMNDSGRAGIDDITTSTRIELSAGQHLVVHFDSDREQFLLE